MMRYQRVSPDCLPLSNGNGNGKKPNIRSLCKDDGVVPLPAHPSSAFRFRSSSAQDSENHNHFHPPHDARPESSPSPSPSPSPSRDMLLQWGQRKRSRASRSLTDDSSSSAQPQPRHRRLLHAPPSEKLPPPPPPPPPPLPSSSSNARSRKEASSSLPHTHTHRNLEDGSVAAAANGSPSRNNCGGSNRVGSRSTAGKRSPPPDKNERKVSSSARLANEKPSAVDRSNHMESAAEHHENTSAPEVVEWPRIYLALSRKEKEDDFYAMKGTKLPQRPKKRAKNIDRALQYCFPGMWLSDLTRSRYEVREKKCVKKQKRKGLKGMESVESDSD